MKPFYFYLFCKHVLTWPVGQNTCSSVAKAIKSTDSTPWNLTPWLHLKIAPRHVGVKVRFSQKKNPDKNKDFQKLPQVTSVLCHNSSRSGGADNYTYFIDSIF